MHVWEYILKSFRLWHRGWFISLLLAIILGAPSLVLAVQPGGGITIPLAPADDRPLQSIVTFNDASTGDITVARLNAFEFVVAYADNSGVSNVRYGQVIGGMPVYGPDVTLNTGATGYLSVVIINSGTFVVLYRDTGNSSYGTARVGEVSGDTITLGSEQVFNSAMTNHISGDRVAANKFVVAFQDAGNSNYGSAMVGTVSGTTITWGGEYHFNAATTGDLSMTAFPWQENKFVVAFRDNGDLSNPNYGKAIAGTVGGNGYEIAYGLEYIFNADVSDMTIDCVDNSTKFVIAYQDRSNSDYGTARAGDVIGSVITFGGEVIFNTAETNLENNLGVKWMATDLFVLGYENASDHDGRAVVGSLIGKSITFESPISYNIGSSSAPPAVVGLGGDYLVAWKDESDGNRGKSRYVGGEIIFLPLILK